MWGQRQRQSTKSFSSKLISSSTEPAEFDRHDLHCICRLQNNLCSLICPQNGIKHKGFITAWPVLVTLCFVVGTLLVPIEGLHDAVLTYIIRAWFCPAACFPFCIAQYNEKNNKKFTSQNDLKFPPSMCANILATLL